MRLPLNVTGVPLLLEQNVWSTVLDISNQPEEESDVLRYMTLFGLATPQVDGDPSIAADVSLRIENVDTGAVIPLGLIEFPGFGGIARAAMLDQLPLRGNVRVSVTTTQTSALAPVFVYGFYEVAGPDQRPARLSPLLNQGSATELRGSRSDRVFDPVLGQVEIDSIPTFVSGVTPAPVTVHQFATDYIDSIDLEIQSKTPGGPPFGSQMWVYDGGDRLAVMPINTTTVGSQAFELFKNIPMKAAAIPSILLPTLPAGIYLVGTQAADEILAWGRYFRY